MFSLKSQAGFSDHPQSSSSLFRIISRCVLHNPDNLLHSLARLSFQKRLSFSLGFQLEHNSDWYISYECKDSESETEVVCVCVGEGCGRGGPGTETKKQKRSDVKRQASILTLFSLCDMILSFRSSTLKQSTWKFSASLLGHLTQESSSISFLLAGRDLLFHWNKRLVCCSLYSHHGDFVWAHDRVGVIVSLQICHSVCQQGSKHNSPFS